MDLAERLAKARPSGADICGWCVDPAHPTLELHLHLKMFDIGEPPRSANGLPAVLSDSSSDVTREVPGPTAVSAAA